MFCGIALAGLVGKSRGDVAKASLLRIVLFGVLLAVGTYLATSTAEFLGVPSLNQETINDAARQRRGPDAGSRLGVHAVQHVESREHATRRSSPCCTGRSRSRRAASVSLVSSLEGVFLLVLTWRARGRSAVDCSGRCGASRTSPTASACC